MKKLLLALAATLLIGQAALPALPVAAQEYGGTLHLNWGTLDTTDFHRHTGTISLPHPFAETLTSIAKDGSPKPLLAESWTVSDDGLTYTFKIRQGVKFHNGRIMTAKDIQANFERIRDKVEAGWLTTAMTHVASFETPDDATFIVKMSSPFSPFLNLIAEAWILAPESPGWDDVITQPIGTGPFTFDSWTPQLVLKGSKFPDYWMKGKPYLDAVEFDVRETADPTLGLRAGDYDVADVPLDKIELLKGAGFDIQFLGGTSWNFVSFNNRNPRPPFDNVRIREALEWAIDRNQFSTILSGKYGEPGNQPVGKDNFFFDADLAANDLHNAPDLEKAKQIIAEEGIKPADYNLYVVTTAGSKFGPLVSQVLRQLGFGVNMKTFDDLGYQRALSEFDWDIYPGGSGARNDIFLRYVRMMSDGPNPGLWGGIQDPALDALINQAASNPDPDASRKLYLDAWKLVMDKHYTFGINQAPSAFGISPKVHDFTVGFNNSAHRVDGGLAFTWIEH
ncbi:MAG: transporter substrate-binding protein [Devosia sp.]|uniref:ABC transporter substrate-binding protein n=1 Tax=Devosia sp. TaxID=1871048 RepID=UPI00260FB4A1|nr:ABC transporter substrate-binding protein [Devosia sp.]MDB5529247.1 transporter substrate-binding protein [Devosia sp.]